jgi:hypothetical protein
MIEIFQDISKYYAANIDGDVLVVGKITFKDGIYSFVPDNTLSRYNLTGQSTDITPIVHAIGEIHPCSVIQKQLEIEITSCVYLNEIDESGEIEVRSIHKGISASIYVKQECPLIRWNAEYEDRRYFDVIDVKHVFSEDRLKNSFIAMLAESLQEYELFPPLLNLDVSGIYNAEEELHDPRIRG